MSEFEHPITYCSKTEMNITCYRRRRKLFHTAPSTRMLSSINNGLNVSYMNLHFLVPHCNW